MSQQFSFSAGQSVTMSDTVDATLNRVDPYDPSFKFNRVVYSKNNKPLYDIYSIDPLKILTAIDNDQLASLYKITLLGRQIMREHLDSGGTGMWDTLFNSAQQKAFTACVFMATTDYTPIPMSRVAISSQFLNYSMLVSRVQKNQVQPGDRVGIGIHDLKEKRYYVLLYVVDEMCNVTIDQRGGARPFLQPGANLTMEHACRFNYDSTGTILDVDDEKPYDEAKAGEFVSWVASAVANIEEAFPFKPHFTPLMPGKMSPAILIERFATEFPNAVPIGFEKFKLVCLEAYDKARVSKLTPVIEVVTHLTSGLVIAKVGIEYNPDNVSYSFPMAEADYDKLTEIHLTNSDLVGKEVSEVNGVTCLPATDEVEERWVRYFNVNF